MMDRQTDVKKWWTDRQTLRNDGETDNYNEIKERQTEVKKWWTDRQS